MSLGFPDLLLLFGAILTVAAALSGWLHGTVLSVSVLSLAAGVSLALLGVLEVRPTDADVFHAVELALLLTLFADGLIVEQELLRREWRKPARTLVAALPVTLVLIAAFAKVLFPALTWAEAFLVGAILAPTDPVVASRVVTSARVPPVVRHVLNLESGLNDGLALPFVLFFLALSVETADPVQEALTLAGESLIGAAAGAGIALAAGRLLARLPGGGLGKGYEGVYALGVALLAFGAADVAGGNGLIAAFVAGLALAFAAREAPTAFVAVNENLSVSLQVVTFVLFGSLIVATYDGPIGALLAMVAATLLVARPLSVLVSFVGSTLPRSHRAFVAWFGPKGAASMLFALLVLRSQAPERTLVFDIAAFVVVSSIVLHGLTDTVLARRFEPRPREAGSG